MDQPLEDPAHLALADDAVEVVGHHLQGLAADGGIEAAHGLAERLVLDFLAPPVVGTGLAERLAGRHGRANVRGDALALLSEEPAQVRQSLGHGRLGGLGPALLPGLDRLDDGRLGRGRLGRLLDDDRLGLGATVPLDAVQPDSLDGALLVEAEVPQLAECRRLLGQRRRIVEVGFLEVEVEGLARGALVQGEDVDLDGLLPQVDPRVDGPLPVVLALLLAELAAVQPARHRHAEHVGAHREGRQDVVAVEGGKLGDADLFGLGRRCGPLHRLGEEQQAPSRVRVGGDVPPCPLDVDELVLCERPVLRGEHPRQSPAGGQHVRDVARHEARQRHLRLDRLDHADAPHVIVGRPVGDLHDLGRVEGDTDAVPVEVHDPADKVPGLVARGRHPGRADAVDGGRQAGRALQIQEGRAGHVEPDHRLLEQLPPGLLRVGPLHEPHELFDGRERGERDVQVRRRQADLLLTAVVVTGADVPVERGEVGGDAMLGLVEPADPVGLQVRRHPLLLRRPVGSGEGWVVCHRDDARAGHGLGATLGCQHGDVGPGVSHATAPKLDTRRRARARA